MQRRVRMFYALLLGVLALCALGERLTMTARPSTNPPATSLRPMPLPPLAANDPESLSIPVVGVERSALRDSFGAPRVAHQHHAIDIMAQRGTPVIAAVDGTVLKLFLSREGGNTLYLADRSRTNVYYYAHLDRYAPAVHDGMTVTRGTLLGFVGTTGNASPDAPHLHFGIERLPPTGEWWKGDPTDPYPILMAHGRTVAG